MGNPLARVMPFVAVGAFVVIAAGVAMAGNLPFGLQQAVSEAASEFGVNVPSPSTTFAVASTNVDSGNTNGSERSREVRDLVERYKRDLRDWSRCVAGVRSQRDAATSERKCGPKPDLVVPDPPDSQGRGGGTDAPAEPPGHDGADPRGQSARPDAPPAKPDALKPSQQNRRP